MTPVPEPSLRAGRGLDPSLQAAVERLAVDGPGMSWSVCVRRTDGSPCAAIGADATLPTASVGKILLLAEVARRIDEDAGAGAVLLERASVEPVGEAGLWQALRVDALAVEDIACLVAGLSDNLATNVLLAHIGLPAVDAMTRSLGLRATALLDRVRMQRAPGDPPCLSVGTAAEWSEVLGRIAAGTLVSPGVSKTLRTWLSGNADLSMFAMPFGFDPLAHRGTGASLFNKTGSDPGTRADVGCVRAGDRSIGYAVIVRWGGDDDAMRDVAIAAMQAMGAAARRFLATPEDARATRREEPA